jgi:Tfp pilus assembly protein PilN
MRDINLIPYDVILLDELYQRFRWWMVVLAGVCFMIGGLLLVQNSVIATIDGEVRQLEKRNAALKARYEEIKHLQEKKKELARKARIVEGLLATRNFSQFFVELEQSMTPAIRLTSLDLDKKNILLGDDQGEWVDTGYFVVKKNAPGTTAQKDKLKETPNLIIKGVTLSHDDLAFFIDALEQLPRFNNVNLRQCKKGEGEKQDIIFELDAQVLK